MVTKDDIDKIEIKVGTVTAAERVEGTDKLMKLDIDFGDEKRQVLTGVAEYLEPEHFVGKQIPVFTNLQPRKFRGLESQGMILAVDVDGKPVLLHPEEEVPNGSQAI